MLTEELHRKAYNGAFEHFNLKIKGEPVVWTEDYYDVLQVTCVRQWVPRDVLDSEGGQRQFSTVANEIVDGCKSGWEAISGGKKPFAEYYGVLQVTCVRQWVGVRLLWFVVPNPPFDLAACGPAIRRHLFSPLVPRSGARFTGPFGASQGRWVCGRVE